VPGGIISFKYIVKGYKMQTFEYGVNTPVVLLGKLSLEVRLGNHQGLKFPDRYQGNVPAIFRHKNEAVDFGYVRDGKFVAIKLPRPFVVLDFCGEFSVIYKADLVVLAQAPED
jgi:hypothetical protein